MAASVPCRHAWAIQGAACACRLCGRAASLWVNHDGTPDVLYAAQPHQVPYHQSTLPNLLMIGPRASGKTTAIRHDLHMRAMQISGFKYLVLRRTFPELRRSHLIYIGEEMRRLGGTFHQTDSLAKYANGSLGFYGHLDSSADAMKYLSAEYDAVAPDEIVTFTEEQILRVAACIRVPVDAGRIGLLRGGMNKLGVGASFVKRYFVDKNVSLEQNPDYHPDDYGIIVHHFEDNAYIDQAQYRSRLQALPEHVRRAWLDDEWVVEGAYFTDFRPRKDGEPWHVVSEIPRVPDAATGLLVPLISQPWVNIYRAIDWGYDPDPAVCLWIAVLPNKRALVFKERTWKRTLAEDVARQIRRESEGMHIVETVCDPVMLINDGRGSAAIGDLFERHGVPLTPSVNKRDLYGFAIHQYLNTIIDGLPQLQILSDQGNGYGCPKLIETLPLQQMDPSDPNKLANGDDHHCVSLAYWCLCGALPSHNPLTTKIPLWLLPKGRHRWYAQG